MAKLFFICTIFVIIFFQTTKAQDSIPLLKGKVTISITKGTIDCDFTLSSFVSAEIYHFEFQKTTFPTRYSFFKSREITQFFKGSLFSLRAPPSFIV